MKKTEIMNKITRAANMTAFKVKKYSPEIFMVVGIAAGIAGAVSACKATLKVSEVKEEAKNKMDEIHAATEMGITDDGKPYDLEVAKKETTQVYLKTGLKVAKLYAPAVSLGVVSIVCVTGSYKELRKRNIALAAAYTAVDKGFKEYRGRVVERFGEELDKELRYNIKATQVDEIVVNEDGSETVSKKTVNVVDPNCIDDTSRIWYNGNPGWTKDPELNLMYLKRQQAWATEKLKEDGVLFLNDVYEMLGFNKTSYGQYIGWIYDEKNPVGDNFVDFGIYDIHNKQKIAFVNGDEDAILLEFNHDGYILKKMWMSEKEKAEQVSL